MNKTTLLVLAAGMGSRYGGLKQLDHIGPSGETIIDYSIYDAIQAGFNKIVFVIRHSFEEEFKALFLPKLEGKVEVQLAYQELETLPEGFTKPLDREKPWGTGHAIWVAKHLINEPFAMINADDFYGREAFDIMARHLQHIPKGEKGLFAMCGYKLGNTLSENGSVSRGVCEVNSDGTLNYVKEHTSISRDSSNKIVSLSGDQNYVLPEDCIVSMNFWGFTPDIFQHLEDKLKAFLNERGNELKSELYIPFVVDELMQENKAQTRVFPCNAQWFGVTYKEDKELAIKSVNSLIDAKLYTDNLWLNINLSK